MCSSKKRFNDALVIHRIQRKMVESLDDLNAEYRKKLEQTDTDGYLVKSIYLLKESIDYADCAAEAICQTRKLYDELVEGFDSLGIKTVQAGDETTKRPYAQQNAQRRSIYTDDETWLKLLDLGERVTGKRNASAGIREAVRRAEERDDETDR